MNDKICSVCGSNKRVTRHKNIAYCKNHYYQITRYGKILKRTKNDLNEIIKYDTYAEILLYDKYNNEVAKALIDLDDVEKIKNYKWGIGNGGYTINANNSILLHRFILNIKPKYGYVVDHINRNRLDCRKNNLRITTFKENSINRGTQSNNTSGVTGVSFEKRRNKWESHIKSNGKKKFLGYYDCIEDAIKARKEAEILYFGYMVDKQYDKNTYFKNKKHNNLKII
jgi:hypothetical protein